MAVVFRHPVEYQRHPVQHAREGCGGLSSAGEGARHDQVDTVVSEVAPHEFRLSVPDLGQTRVGGSVGVLDMFGTSVTNNDQFHPT